MPLEILDITRELRPGMPVFPGDPPFRSTALLSTAAGHPCNLCHLSFGSHIGTHADAPRHLFSRKAGIDRIPLEHFIGRARVLDLTGCRQIRAADLRPLGIRSGQILLFKTVPSGPTEPRLPGKKTVSGLARDAAEYLVGRSVRTVGIDVLNVEPADSPLLEVHRLLLAAGIVILEGLDLRRVEPGRYWLHAPPLKIRGGDGAPLRAVLLKGKK